jgi:hypothetical protein
MPEKIIVVAAIVTTVNSIIQTVIMTMTANKKSNEGE